MATIGNNRCWPVPNRVKYWERTDLWCLIQTIIHRDFMTFLTIKTWGGDPMVVESVVLKAEKIQTNMRWNMVRPSWWQWHHMGFLRTTNFSRAYDWIRCGAFHSHGGTPKSSSISIDGIFHFQPSSYGGSPPGHGNLHVLMNTGIIMKTPRLLGVL